MNSSLAVQTSSGLRYLDTMLQETTHCRICRVTSHFHDGNDIVFGGGTENYGESQECVVTQSMQNRFGHLSNNVDVKISYE